MLDKLELLEQHYDDLSRRMSDPEVASSHLEYQRLAKERAQIEETVEKYREWKHVAEQIEEARSLSHEEEDAEMRVLAKQEMEAGLGRKETLERELELLLLPKDPNDDKNVIVEVRAGTGGEEAGLFASQLARMYQRYAERRGWKIETISVNPTGLGGIKEATFVIVGQGAYSRLKYESGVHRVQRVPATESSGRIHTSAATVAVLPEAEEVDVEISPDDLEIDTFRASSAGGQNVQKNETAVRIRHVPSGLVVSCQDERSQHQNKEKGMRLLRSRLLEQTRAEQEREIAASRRSQVRGGDRSEKIRTYNFPQDRVTDHRIGLTLHRIENILDGEIDEMTEALAQREREERLATASGQ